MFHGGIRADRRARAALALCALAGLIGAAGCSSGGGGSQPSWASSLGSGVTVVSPGTASPGNGTPDGVMIGVVDSITSGHFTDLCKYEMPATQSQCNSAMSQVTPSVAASQLPSFKNMKLGYTAVDGTKAIIGITGTVCLPNQTPSCFTNNDPAALFDSGKSFAALWTQALNAPQNAYSLSTVEEVNGSWYAYTSSSS